MENDNECCGACPMHGACVCQFGRNGRCMGEHFQPDRPSPPFSRAGTVLLGDALRPAEPSPVVDLCPDGCGRYLPVGLFSSWNPQTDEISRVPGVVCPSHGLREIKPEVPRG